MCREPTDVVPFYQLDIALLLAGNNMTHQNGAAGRHGFMHDGTTCLANIEMMGAEQLWYLVRPPYEMGANSINESGSGYGLVQSLEASGNYGDFNPRKFLQFSNDGKCVAHTR